MKKPPKRLVVVALLLCVIAIIVTASILLRMRQGWSRSCGQRALDAVQYLKIGSSDSCKLLREWKNEFGSRVTSEGSCNDLQSFRISFHIQHPPYFVPLCFERQFGRIDRTAIRVLCATYDALNGTGFEVDAQIEAVNGYVTKKSSSVLVVVPDDAPAADLPAYVHASAEVPVKLAKRRSRPDTQSDIEQAPLHPSYRIFVGTSLANADSNPGGRIFYSEAEIGPDGSANDSERLFAFDLSCITRARPCSRRDLIPAAYDQHERDSQIPSAQ